MFGDFAAKDDGDLVGLTDGAVGIEKTLAKFIESSTAMEDQIVTVLYLSKEEAMLTMGLAALIFGEEGSEAIEPLATAGQQIAGGQRIGELLKPLGVRATQEGVVVCWKSMPSSRKR